ARVLLSLLLKAKVLLTWRSGDGREARVLLSLPAEGQSSAYCVVSLSVSRGTGGLKREAIRLKRTVDTLCEDVEHASIELVPVERLAKRIAAGESAAHVLTGTFLLSSGLVVLMKRLGARHPHECLQVFRWAETSPIPMKEVHYDTMITMMGRSPLPVRNVLDILQLMQRSGRRPSSYTYNSVLIACEKRGKWREAVEVLSEMRQAGLRADRVTYNAVIKACAKGALKQAREVGRLLESSGSVEDEDIERARVKAGAARKQAEELLKRMRKSGLTPSAATLSSLIQAYIRAGYFKNAMDVFKDMRRADLAPSCEVYESLLRASQTGDRAVAWVGKIVEKIRRSDKVPNESISYSLLVRALVDRGVLMERDVSASPLLIEQGEVSSRPL
ncbi:hypothetical protein CYMTET_34698, partial [Cymbomonas tetramitiformis]